MKQYINGETIRIAIASASFIAILVLIFFIYRFLFIRVRRKVLLTSSKLDDFIPDIFKVPALWLFYWILLKIFTHIFLKDLPFFSALVHVDTQLLIFSITWISIQFIKAGAFCLQNRLDIDTYDNLIARKSLTQIRVFKGIADTFKNWSLRTEIREKLIDFINVNYPETFSKIRIKSL